MSGLSYPAFALFAIVLSMMVIFPSDFTQTADAAKAEGIKAKKYGLATKNIVCGDRMCTPDDFTKEGVKIESISSAKTSEGISSMMTKMERLFDLHRMQITSVWDSLTFSEKTHMMQMIDKMYEKMQSMDFREHMNHMSMMMDYSHGMKGEHGCSCGEGEHGCSCGTQSDMTCEPSEKQCTCSEDGVCTCDEGCTCTSCN